MVDAAIHVVAADLMRGDLLLYFSDGTTTLFHGPFLYSVRHHDGNVSVSEEPEEEDRPEDTTE